MAKTIQAIRGMNDCLPTQTPLWQKVEKEVRAIMASYGYSEVRTPIIESTPLFARAIGEVTDVVEKEMFTFEDRDNDSLTLRPEGTAGCVRSSIEHGLIYNQEQRFWYMGPMFRYERPQKGRYRQFHQVGVEVFGIKDPIADVEVIMLGANLWKRLGIFDHVTLQLNTIGSLAERKHYRSALVEFLTQHQDLLDEDCKRRLTTNPLRILDSKNEQVQNLLNDAPKLHDYLEEESKQHFAEVCRLLEGLGIQYEINQKLVRGLDYYNKTVFEWVTTALGAQGTVCGGGRYDGLVEQLGGHGTPGIGFAIGLERLVLLVEATRSNVDVEGAVDVYVVHSGKETDLAAFKMVEMLRHQTPHIRYMLHGSGGNFKKQFKRADRVGATLALVLGETELADKTVVIKSLRTNEEQKKLPQIEVAEYIQHLLNERKGE